VFVCVVLFPFPFPFSFSVSIFLSPLVPLLPSLPLRSPLCAPHPLNIGLSTLETHSIGFYGVEATDRAFVVCTHSCKDKGA